MNFLGNVAENRDINIFTTISVSLDDAGTFLSDRGIGFLALEAGEKTIEKFYENLKKKIAFSKLILSKKSKIRKMLKIISLLLETLQYPIINFINIKNEFIVLKKTWLKSKFT